MSTRTIMRLSLLIAVIAALAHTAVAQPVSNQYIVVLKPAKGSGGFNALPPADVERMGGHVDYTLPNRVVVTLPDNAVEALRKHQSVKYMQKVVFGPVKSAQIPTVLRIATTTSVSLQPAPQSTVTWSSGTYQYDGSGNIVSIGLPGEGVITHAYQYDLDSRLKKSVVSGTFGGTEEWSYDLYGNITQRVRDGVVTTVDVVSATNRMRVGTNSPYTYDAAGDLASDANASYIFDPLQQMGEKDFGTTANEVYVYTADDQRIGVKQGTAWTWSIRDFSGNVLRQYRSDDSTYSMPWLWVEDYVYRDGVRVGAERVPEEGGRRQFHLDHLGSPRLVTGTNGLEVASHEFRAFGIENNPLWQVTTAGFDREDPMRFTGHERDFAVPWMQTTTAYLDYMHARYYDPNEGRFLSVDSGEPDLDNPQSWNRYTYALNSPVALVDPDGRNVVINGDTDEERKKAFDALKQSLHDNFAASRLMMVKVGDHYEAKVAGSLAEFKGGNDTAFTLGIAIGESAKIGIGLGPVDPSNYGAVTNQVAGTHDSNITVDPTAFPQILGGLYQTMDTAIQHELGHALAYATLSLDDLKAAALLGPGTNEEALHSENMARAWYVKQIEMTYGKDSAAARAARRIYRPRLKHGADE